MRAIPQHPGREWRRCETHRDAFYPRAAGCPVCKADRLAQKLADHQATQRLVAVTDRLHREHALAQLERDTQAVVEAARSEVARIDRMLAEDAQRKHEQRVNELGRGLYECMTGGAS